jgi:hypothetical protein
MLMRESIPVPVPYGQSDIDFVAINPRLQAIHLPDDRTVGPRLIVEAKDEHDWDPQGKEFGKLLISDVALLNAEGYIPAGTRNVKFSMLRQQHFVKAADLFGTHDFDRLFVVHAIDQHALAAVSPVLRSHRIHWITIRELVADLLAWYRAHPRPSGLRHSMTGDLLHLLVGYCGLKLPEVETTPILGDSDEAVCRPS